MLLVITVILTAQSLAPLTTTSQRCSIMHESGDDPGEWDHCYDPKSTLGEWVHYNEACLKQSWWIRAPGRDRCSYRIKWPNASWGVRRDWRVRNVENTSLNCCCSLEQERGVQPFSQILIIPKFVLTVCFRNLHWNIKASLCYILPPRFDKTQLLYHLCFPEAAFFLVKNKELCSR